MKKITTKISSAMQPQRLLISAFLLLDLCLNGLQAQDSIVPAGSTITKLSTNQFQFLEGPVWYRDSGLLFTDADVNPNKIYRYNPSGNQFSVFRNNSAGCNGLTCDKDGNLLGCESKRVVMMNETGLVTKVLANIYNGKAFNGPNDLIADDKGGVYFTDPVYFVTPTQDKEAVYYIDSAGKVTRIIDDLLRPNGVVLSPGGTRLYVGDANTNYIYSWDVADDGSVSGKSIFAELATTGGPLAGSDGMAVDINGNLYFASEKGIQVFSSGGAALTTIVVPELPSNCDFGGADFKTLFITARKNIYSIDLNYPGYAVSRNTSHTGINSIPGKPSVEIYPNPVQNELNINLPGKSGTVEVFDITGKSLLQKEILENENSIDVSGLENGIYFVKVLSDSQFFTEKFVKY
jgi:gluconolactonase